jgi:hypothetical protein
VGWWVGASIFLSVYYVWSKEKCSREPSMHHTPPSHWKSFTERQRPRPNCIVSEFFVRFWHIAGEEYFNTIKDSIVVRNFSKGVTKEVITLIFKTGDKR